MILLHVVLTVIITEGLHTAKSMGLCAAISSFHQLVCYVAGGLSAAKSMGLHAAKSCLGSLRNLKIYTLDLNLGKSTIITRKTKYESVLIWSG